jgi:hypothetical protein
MRTIKFRAWDGKKMRTWGFTDGGFISPPSESGGHDYPQMQFTGLYDKNGKEIYEGDIVRMHGYLTDKKVEVKWQETSGFFPFADSPENCGHCGGANSPKRVEVIGNIYENPELIEKLS